jgi:chromosome segregation ATPase
VLFRSVEIIDSLESRIQKLFNKINSLEKNSTELAIELERANSIIKTQEQELVNLKSTIDSLKMANSLLGSEENKRDTKLKINSLIREIDYCVAQLSE